jgi:chromosome segregation ATPase
LAEPKADDSDEGVAFGGVDDGDDDVGELLPDLTDAECAARELSHEQQSAVVIALANDSESLDRRCRELEAKLAQLSEERDTLAGALRTETDNLATAWSNRREADRLRTALSQTEHKLAKLTESNAELSASLVKARAERQAKAEEVKKLKADADRERQRTKHMMRIEHKTAQEHEEERVRSLRADNERLVASVSKLEARVSELETRCSDAVRAEQKARDELASRDRLGDPERLQYEEAIAKHVADLQRFTAVVHEQQEELSELRKRAADTDAFLGAPVRSKSRRRISDEEIASAEEALRVANLRRSSRRVGKPPPPRSAMER